MLLLGLVSWLLAGLLAGFLAHRLLPAPSPRLANALLFGVLGAVAGGLLATALGFGGLAGYDPRALITATLTSVLTLLLLRLRGTAPR